MLQRLDTCNNFIKLGNIGDLLKYCPSLHFWTNSSESMERCFHISKVNNANGPGILCKESQDCSNGITTAEQIMAFKMHFLMFLQFLIGSLYFNLQLIITSKHLCKILNTQSGDIIMYMDQYTVSHSQHSSLLIRIWSDWDIGCIFRAKYLLCVSSQ